jgi:hypothetical protein
MSAGENAPDHLGDRFAQACSTVRRLLAEAIREDVRARHRLGAFLCEVRGATELYGHGAIDRIARDLGVGADTLYRCAAVADSWSAEGLEDLMGRTSRCGDPLSWSHFVALTKLDSAPQRALAIEKCLDEDFSVRDLARYLTAVRGVAAHPEGGERDGPSTKETLTEGVRKLSRAVLQMDVFLEAIDARVSSEDPADDALLARVIGACQTLHEKLDATVDRLRHAQASSGCRLRAEPSPHSAESEEAGDEEDDPPSRATQRVTRPR